MRSRLDMGSWTKVLLVYVDLFRGEIEAPREGSP
jgi:hypothetical protein